MSARLPLVSIGLPVYNGENYVAETLGQLQSQGYPRIELIISDNASTDNTETVCREIASRDSRLRYFRQPTNTGIGRNWEFVCQQATGDYFLWAAHDDEWSPNAISAMVDTLEDEADAVLAFPQNFFINEHREKVIDCSQLPDLAGPLPLLQRLEHVLWFEEGAQKGNLVHGLMRTKAAQRVGVPALDGSSFPDWGGDQLFVFGMAFEGYFAHVPEAQFYKRYFPSRRYDADGLIDHFHEMHGYFVRLRRLIDESTLDGTSREVLLASLAARETTWYCRVMNANNTADLRGRLFKVIEQCDKARESVQVVTSSEPKADFSNSLTSIVILNYNNLQHLRSCLSSLRQYTTPPHEVIVFDNASTDGSLDYLRTIPNITLVESPVNFGCTVGRWKATSLARGDFVVYLDNDTIVTPGWLTRMITHLHQRPDVGMLGPRSNYVSGPQLVSKVSYRNSLELAQFAKYWSWAASGPNALLPTNRLVGFCMVFRRDVLDKIGGPDPNLGMFAYDDDDLTLRVALAGYKAMIANDVFIHHTGGPQTRGDAVYNDHMREAWSLFKQKWGIPLALGIDQPYNAKALLSQAFDPEKHYTPIPHPSTLAAFIYNPNRAGKMPLHWQDSTHPHAFSAGTVPQNAPPLVEDGYQYR